MMRERFDLKRETAEGMEGEGGVVLQEEKLVFDELKSLVDKIRASILKGGGIFDDEDVEWTERSSAREWDLLFLRDYLRGVGREMSEGLREVLELVTEVEFPDFSKLMPILGDVRAKLFDIEENCVLSTFEIRGILTCLSAEQEIAVEGFLGGDQEGLANNYISCTRQIFLKLVRVAKMMHEVRNQMFAIGMIADNFVEFPDESGLEEWESEKGDFIGAVRAAIRVIEAFLTNRVEDGGKDDSRRYLLSAFSLGKKMSLADCKYELDDDLPFMPKEKIFSLVRVFSNLMSNAVDAVEDLGRKGEIDVKVKVEGERLVMFVRDNGVGIPKEVRLSFFNVGVSTKSKGCAGDRGLGMEIFGENLKRLGGCMFFSTMTEEELVAFGEGEFVERGTVFRVSIPVANLIE